MSTWHRLHADQRGLESIEYLLIAGLIIVASIGAWKFLGRQIATDVKKEAETIDETVQRSLDEGTASSPVIAEPAQPPATSTPDTPPVPVSPPAQVTTPPVATTPPPTSTPPPPKEEPSWVTTSGSYGDPKIGHGEWTQKSTPDNKNGEYELRYYDSKGNVLFTEQANWSTDADGTMRMTRSQTKTSSNKTITMNSVDSTGADGKRTVTVSYTLPDGSTTTDYRAWRNFLSSN